MLKRGDLTKQFELLVQQEIKNHNDSVLSTNISINNLKDHIDQLSKKLDAHVAASSNTFVFYNIDIDKLKKSFDQLSSKCEYSLNDFSSNIQSNNKRIEDLAKTFESYVKNQKDQNEKLSLLDNLILGIQDKICNFFSNIKNEIYRNQLKSEDSLRDLKQEILNRPSEAKVVKKEIEDKMSIWAIDFSGLMKEIQINKKTDFITQKKIENLYTLIERLEKRIPQ